MYEDENKSYNNNSYNGYSYDSNKGPYSGSTYNSGSGAYGYGGNNQGYGTYKYSTDQNAASTAPQPVKKKKHGAAIAIVILSLIILAGATCAGLYFFRAKGSMAPQSVAQIEEDDDQTSAQAGATASAQEDKDDQQAKTTTTASGETRVVVSDVTGVVEKAMPSMVIIHNNRTVSYSYFGYVQEEEETGSGSGIIVGKNDTELLVATNYHVVEGADSLEVIFNNEQSAEAVVKGTNSDMDLAVIAIMLENIPQETMNSIEVATLGDSDSLKLGEPAIAIGNALGYGQSVTTGVISALNRELESEEGGEHRKFIQTDAAINPGNSGGALLNLNGEVIGINSNKLGGNVIEGMGYAIPISFAKPIIEQLMNEKTMIKVSDEERGYLGISGISVTSDVSERFGIPQGVFVSEVSQGGGAEAAGIKKNDVITKFDGHEITSMDDLQTRLQYYKAGTAVKLTVMRSGDDSEYKETELEVTLGKASEDKVSSGSYSGKPQQSEDSDEQGDEDGDN